MHVFGGARNAVICRVMLQLFVMSAMIGSFS